MGVISKREKYNCRAERMGRKKFLRNLSLKPAFTVLAVLLDFGSFYRFIIIKWREKKNRNEAEAMCYFLIKRYSRLHVGNVSTYF